MHDRFDGFTVNIFLDDDDAYVAHFVELPEISAFGKTHEQALAELASAWEGVKLLYGEEGKPIPIAPSKREYSSQFNARIDRGVHRALAVEAAQAGVTLNALVSQRLA